MREYEVCLVQTLEAKDPEEAVQTFLDIIKDYPWAYEVIEVGNPGRFYTVDMAEEKGRRVREVRNEQAI